MSSAYLPQALRWQVLGWVPTVTLTTIALLAGFEGSYLREAKPYYFAISVRAMAAVAAIVWFWMVIFGVFVALRSAIRSEEWVIVVMLGVILAFYAAGAAIPVCITYMLVRKHLRRESTDNYIRCHQCDYRADNLSGPRCPECGTSISGLVEDPTA